MYVFLFKYQFIKVEFKYLESHFYLTIKVKLHLSEISMLTSYYEQHPPCLSHVVYFFYLISKTYSISEN